MVLIGGCRVEQLVAIELAILSAGLLVTVLHTLVPDHWLPFVVVGQSHRWPLVKTLRLTLLFSLVHVGLTVILGLGLALLSLELLRGIEGLQEAINGLILIALGVLVTFLHRAGMGDRRTPGAEGLSKAGLLSLFGVAPCYPILPVFLSAQALGWGLTLGLAGLFSLVTMSMMALMVFFGGRGLLNASKSPGWKSIERWEGMILGGTLVILGLLILLI
jgi:hypothetical protein